jgi:CBS domain-containing protein
MSVGEYCNREVVIAERSTSVREAARLMRKHHTGDLVVVERKGKENIPVGIVTDRDLVVEVLAEDAPMDMLTVADLMSSDLATVREQEELWVVLNRMRSLGVRRMPVVSERGTLVGILTMDDAVELISEALSDMSQLVRREISEEVHRRPPLPH